MIPWNKGLKLKPLTEEHKEKIRKNATKFWLGKKLPEETREKMSKSMKGKIISTETKRKISETNKRLGRRPPLRLGIKMSQETKDKIGRANAVANKGKKQSAEQRHNESLAIMGEKNHFFGKKHSDETKRKISKAKLRNPSRYWLGKNRESMMGKNNWNWNNGSSDIGYPVNWKKSLKRSIRERDHYICQMPGRNRQQEDIAHDVHHIDYDKNNCDPKNLLTLCHRCHMRTNTKREYWKKYFKNIIDLIYADRKLQS